MNKTFTFVAVWPRRSSRQAHPYQKVGVVSAADEAAAEALLRASPHFSGVERIAVVQHVSGFEVMRAG